MKTERAALRSSNSEVSLLRPWLPPSPQAAGWSCQRSRLKWSKCGFSTVKPFFEDRHIDSARRRFNAILDHLPAEVCMQVIDLIRDRDTFKDPYKELKIRLSSDFTVSRWKRIELLEQAALVTINLLNLCRACWHYLIQARPVQAFSCGVF